MKTFKKFFEEVAVGGDSGVPANNASVTPGVDGFTPETVGVNKNKKKPKLMKRGDSHVKTS